ncbi:B-cell antigen receptor complex-associated protein beta chain precursor [Monodelphis domestica]|uniref:B-cell antigen receptor complex-associated protein beta chain n=1 Tax=Monodelphis domestica TaxID=13616 RepID=D7F469_MONDO|nr:B-cell antigen receptor complex-associated protein beta chain precursor [Monodelphis domestica]ACZ13438.1 CD79b [Monodelphis domestica]
MAGLGLPTIFKEGLGVLLLIFSAGEMVLGSQTIEEAIPESRGNTCTKLWQYPRFMAKKRDSSFSVTCHVNGYGQVTWLRKQESDASPQVLKTNNGQIVESRNGSTLTLTIQKIQFEDNGIYYCQQVCMDNPNKIFQGCGTELRVMGYSTVAQLKRRNTLKDAIIMIQTLLIIVFITVPVFLLLDKDDNKVVLEDDHTYEGLEIDQTATYEDIVTLRTGEVKWSVGEHPGQE